MQELERRAALANFLRARRARLSPADVGMPAGMRRRTPGLRREEVAQLANIGTSWYVWLEQARDVHPSPEVLECLAQALRLTLNERRHLFLLAGQPVPALISAAEESAIPALRRMLEDLDPSPAYALGRRYDYLASNRAATCLFGISETASPYERNLLWRIFTSPTMRKRPNWEQIARGTLAEFRVNSARYPGDKWFEELIEDLKQASPEFCCWWPYHDARSTLDGPKLIEHPTLGLLEFEHISLQVLSTPDIRVVIYSPLGETRAKLTQLLKAMESHELASEKEHDG